MTDSMFDLFLELGEFYEKKGYAGMQHSRLKRCEILLEFLEEKDAPKELFREALTFDLYARENCKTRPDWAPAVDVLREVTRKYCTNGKLSHAEPFHYRFPGKNEIGVRELPERFAFTVWALFHYEERDPLDHQAKVEYLEIE